MFHRNEGPLDRGLRLVAGMVLLPVGLFVLGGVNGAIVGLIPAVFGVVGLVTAATGFCPTYTLFRFSTLRQAHPAPTL
jgi:Protein of unknown function (DUF2892)